MAYRIVLRRDTSTNWTTNNPVLLLGEPGFETDTSRMKIGDGSTLWQDLPYYVGYDLLALDSDLIPATGGTYDLGATAGYSWRDLYLSGNTIYLGDATLSAVGSSVSMDTIILGGPTSDGGVIVSATGGYLTSDGSVIVGPIGATGPTGPAGEGFSPTGGIIFPFLPGNNRTGSGNNLQFEKGEGYQKIISTQDGTEFDVTVERLVVSGGDSYFDGSEYIGEGGDIYLWAGKGGDGGDIKVDAGESTDGYGGSIKIRGGYSQSNSGGFVEILSGSGSLGGGNISIIAQNGGTGSQFGGEIYLQTSEGVWAFKNNGGLRFPDGTIQTTAFSVIEHTYSELYSIVNEGTLIPGAWYLITDFQSCYDQPDYDYYGNPITTGNYRTATIDPIIVFATSENSLSPDAYQPSYPNDKIKYDINWNTTEVSNSPAKGRITERIDEFNNRTDYDHRSIKFKRYKSYFSEDTLDGTIIGMDNGTVTGYNTSFLSQGVTGSVVFIQSQNPNYYKITGITSNTQMTVEGITYDNFITSNGYRIQTAYSIPQQGASGSLYYFNDIGQNFNISDGGNDMYDTANIIVTDLSFDNVDIPYTHTQMTSPPIDEYQQVPESAFSMDGSVEIGDPYFGTGSKYFTNLYPGLFVMSASGVQLDYFSIDGNLGSDSQGEADLFDYTTSVSGNDYSVYCKRVWNAGDPSVNHIFIVNNIDENITHTADLTTADDFDKISGLTGVTEIHYLLFGLARGAKATDSQIQNIVESYLGLSNGNDINTILSNLNSDYTLITSNLPENDPSYVSLNYKKTNIIGDNDYFEGLTFSSFINSAMNNYIGDYARYYTIDENTFILSNNIFTDSFDNGVDVLSNTFGNNFFNNTFSNDVIRNSSESGYFSRNLLFGSLVGNIIGTDFNNNTAGNFINNVIGSLFSGNFFIGGFNNNTTGYNFSNNRILNNYYFHDNIISSEFLDNTIRDDFYNNEIGTNFSSNQIIGQLDNNSIGNDFYGNNLFSSFHNNRINSHFESNDIYNTFSKNTIKNYFDNNTIGTSLAIGNGEFSQNEAGNYVKGNIFYGYNSGNKYGENFTGNEIANGLYDNTFGFECLFNDIGENFTNNILGNYFTNNIVGYNFTNNYICNNVSNSNFTTYYGNILGFGYTPEGTTASDNTYIGLTGSVSGGPGSGASFDVIVSGGTVYSVTLNAAGTQYTTNDTITIPGTSIGGVYNVIVAYSSNGVGKNGVDGSYPSLSVTGGSGTGADFDVNVSGGLVDNVSIYSVGTGYQVGNSLKILGSQFGGTDGIDDITITVDSIYSDNIVIGITGTSQTPSVYETYTCQIFERQGGDKRLSFYDENDILTIKNINE